MMGQPSTPDVKPPQTAVVDKQPEPQQPPQTQPANPEPVQNTDPTPDPQPTEPAIPQLAEKLQSAQAAIEALDFDKAVDTLETIKDANGQRPAEAEELLTQARAEQQFRQNLDLAKKEFAANRPQEAQKYLVASEGTLAFAEEHAELKQQVEAGPGASDEAHPQQARIGHGAPPDGGPVQAALRRWRHAAAQDAASRGRVRPEEVHRHRSHLRALLSRAGYDGGPAQPAGRGRAVLPRVPTARAEPRDGAQCEEAGRRLRQEPETTGRRQVARGNHPARHPHGASPGLLASTPHRRRGPCRFVSWWSMMSRTTATT